MKVSVSVFSKNEENLGGGDLFIYKDSFQKKEKNIKKWLAINNESQRKSVILTQGIKFAHTKTQMLKMLLRITINYDVTNYVDTNKVIDKNITNTTNNINNNTNTNNINNNNISNTNNNNDNTDTATILSNIIKRASVQYGTNSIISQDKNNAGQDKRQSVAAQILSQLAIVSDKKRASVGGGNIGINHNQHNNTSTNPQSISNKSIKNLNNSVVVNSNNKNTNNANENILLTSESKKGKQEISKNTNQMNMSMMTIERKSILLEDSPKKDPKPIPQKKPSPKKIDQYSTKSKSNINNKSDSKDRHKDKYQQYENYHKSFNDKIGHKTPKNVQEPISTEPAVLGSKMDLIIVQEDKGVYEESRRLNAFRENFSKLYQESKLDKLNLKNGLKKEAEDILLKLLEFQTLYYKLHKDQISNNVQIKELYVSYNEKLRSYNKKLNKLKENLESVNVRLTLTNANLEENKKIKELIRITEKEIDFHRKILRLRYDETDLEKFKQEKQNRDEYRDKNFLLRVFENICKDHDKVKKIANDNRKICHGILIKNQIDIKGLLPVEPKKSIQPRASSVGRSNNTQKQRGSQFNSRKSLAKNVDMSAYNTQPSTNIEANKSRASNYNKSQSSNKRISSNSPNKR